MAQRMLLYGRVVIQSKDWPQATDSLPRNKAGEIIDVRVDPGSPDSPFRAGAPFYDKADEITYRVVRVGGTAPLDGWRSADFWIKRWELDWPRLRILVEKGWLDAAMEEGSAVRRFRCRDEHRVLAWIKDTQEQKKDRARLRTRRRR